MSHSTIGSPRRITDEQVRRAREMNASHQKVAALLGISRSMVSRIKAGFQHKQASPK